MFGGCGSEGGLKSSPTEVTGELRGMEGQDPSSTEAVRWKIVGDGLPVLGVMEEGM